MTVVKVLWKRSNAIYVRTHTSDVNTASKTIQDATWLKPVLRTSAKSKLLTIFCVCVCVDPARIFLKYNFRNSFIGPQATPRGEVCCDQPKDWSLFLPTAIIQMRGKKDTTRARANSTEKHRLMKNLSYRVPVSQSKANSSNLSHEFAKTKKGTTNNGGQPLAAGAPRRPQDETKIRR